MVATAILRQPGVDRAKQLAAAGKALDALAKLAKPDGGIYDKDIPHYITSVSIMALVAGGRAQDKPLIEKGRKYLAEHILDEGEGVPPGDKFYGGLGYGGTSDGGRADIISLEYGLRAMKEAELPANNAAWDKAIKFLQRTQSNSEANDQAWAKNDGGFIYYPGFSQAGEDGLLLLHGVCEGATSRWRADHHGRKRPASQLAGGSGEEAHLAPTPRGLLGKHRQGGDAGQSDPRDGVHHDGDRGGVTVTERISGSPPWAPASAAGRSDYAMRKLPTLKPSGGLNVSRMWRS
jgi:hypothetical protein